MAGGTEWVVDAFGCQPELLRAPDLLVDLSQRVIRLLELKVVGEPVVHQFGGPGGVTALFLLSESHLAWHTYPEVGLTTLNLYCCREQAEIRWEPLLARFLGASEVSVRRLVRGKRPSESLPTEPSRAQR